MEINSHYGVIEYARGKLLHLGYDVLPIRQSDDGSGALAIVRRRGRDMSTAVPYYLPMMTDVIDDQIRRLGESEDSGEAWDRSRQK